MVFVANTAVVDRRSEVLDDARVEGFANVSLSELHVSARVENHAVVDNSYLTDRAVVGGSARVSYSDLDGSARVEGGTQFINSSAHDTARVYGNAYVYNVRVFGSSCVFGNASLDSRDVIVELRGDCKFGGNATFEGLSTVDYFVKKYGADKVKVTNNSSSWVYNKVVLTDVWDMG